MSQPTAPLDRRRFLHWLAGASAFFAAHGCGPAVPKPTIPLAPAEPQLPRLRWLELATAAPLADLAAFYNTQLGLPLLETTPRRLSIRAGQTRLTFRPATVDEGKPFYHFAFDIPEKKVRPAYDWQRKRTPLLPIPAPLRDADYPDEVVHYRHWNAHSIFFFDPAGNVVEYIARHDLANPTEGEFATEDILYASEIAFVVDDVTSTNNTLQKVAAIENYKGASDQFAALGDERGLLLVMKRGRVISFDSPERKSVDVFPTAVGIGGERAGKHEFSGYPYQLSLEK